MEEQIRYDEECREDRGEETGLYLCQIYVSNEMRLATHENQQSADIIVETVYHIFVVFLNMFLDRGPSSETRATVSTLRTRTWRKWTSVAQKSEKCGVPNLQALDLV